jgi:hypothetical protein
MLQELEWMKDYLNNIPKTHATKQNRQMGFHSHSTGSQMKGQPTEEVKPGMVVYTIIPGD